MIAARKCSDHDLSLWLIAGLRPTVKPPAVILSELSMLTSNFIAQVSQLQAILL